MMSRIFPAALACALLLPPLTGCGSTASDEPVTLAVVYGNAQQLVVHGGYLYLPYSTGFERIDVSGGSVERMPYMMPLPFAVDDTHLYYWSAGWEGVIKMPLEGGDQVKLAEPSKDEHGNGPIAVDESSVYWAASDGLKKVPRDGGLVTVLSPGQPTELALDASDVYWTDMADGSVKRTPLGGGETRVLASGQPLLHDIAVSESSVFWMSNGRVHWASKDGTISASSPGEEGNALAVDDEYAYWTDSDRGEVRRMPLAGGELVTLAHGETGALRIVVDDTGLYWVKAEDQVHTAVRQLSK